MGKTISYRQFKFDLISQKSRGHKSSFPVETLYSLPGGYIRLSRPPGQNRNLIYLLLFKSCTHFSGFFSLYPVTYFGLQVMLACFICFSIRAFMLASLVEMQEHGEKSRQVGQGWKK